MFAELLVNFVRVTSGSTDTQLKELIPVNGYESKNNKMQSETIDFAPVPPLSKLYET